jgi:iron complex transport system substrate-binding protein
VYRPPGVLLEWIDPPFGCGHWSPELVRLAGGCESLGRDGQPSRSASWEGLRDLDPAWLVVACCGFDVKRTLCDMPLLAGLPGYRDLTCVRRDRVYVTDGNAYFSRPGPRLVDGLEILAHALHPAVHPLPAGLTPAGRWP